MLCKVVALDPRYNFAKHSLDPRNGKNFTHTLLLEAKTVIGTPATPFPLFFTLIDRE